MSGYRPPNRALFSIAGRDVAGVQHEPAGAQRRSLFGRISGLFRAADTRDFEEVLLGADFGPVIAAELCRAVAGASDKKAALRQELVAMLRHGEQTLTIDPDAAPFVIMFVGVNGTGKTTTMGKLAAKLRLEGLRPLIVAGDTFRAAAVEQAEAWAARAQVPLVRGAPGCDAAGLLFDACAKAKSEGLNVVLADTAGRLHNKRELVDELRKMIRVARKFSPQAPHEIIQVIDAGTGRNAITQAEVFRDAADITGFIMTKLDGTAKGGTALSLVKSLRLPLYALGTGEGIDDLQPFGAEAYADALLAD